MSIIVIIEIFHLPPVQSLSGERHEHVDTNVTTNSRPGTPKQLATNNDHLSDHQNCALGIYRQAVKR